MKHDKEYYEVRCPSEKGAHGKHRTCGGLLCAVLKGSPSSHLIICSKCHTPYEINVKECGLISMNELGKGKIPLKPRWRYVYGRELD
jgi:hypothetical protein